MNRICFSCENKQTDLFAANAAHELAKAVRPEQIRVLFKTSQRLENAPQLCVRKILTTPRLCYLCASA